jgi:prenyltransferase beta subunit
VVFYLLVSLSPCLPICVRADTAESSLAKYDKPVDEAIDRALAYLAKSQAPEGYFAGPHGKSTAIASLCVMAFLTKGYTPVGGPYADVINKGIDFVLSCQQKTGLVVGPGQSQGPFGYDHCTSTLMLSEVSGMVDPARQEKIDKVLPRALKLILAAQQIKKPPQLQGGWRYQPNSPDSDISCTGWALMSLRSARNSGAAVPKEAISDAVKFVINCQAPDGGFCYQPGAGSGLARTGTALLCLELCGMHRDKPSIGAGDYILKHLPSIIAGQDFYYYSLYYCSQGMFQLGGDYWEKFAVNMYETMLKYQAPDGSWPQGAGNESQAGPCFSTAMGVLAMAVSYRQLPIYQR